MMRATIAICAAMLACSALGQSLEFNGTASYSVCNYAQTFNRTDNFAVSLWIRYSGTRVDIQTVFTMRTSGGNTPMSIFIYGNAASANSNLLRADSWNGSTSAYVRHSTLLNDGNWHHICVSHYSNSTFALYIDGAYSGISGAETGSTQSNEHITIGEDTPLGRNFDGEIGDPVRIYSYALSANQVKALYTEQALMRNFEGTYNKLIARDLSGNGNNGTCSAATILTKDPYVNESWHGDFDGSVDYVKIDDNDALDLSTDFSYSAWFKSDIDSPHGLAVFGNWQTTGWMIFTLSGKSRVYMWDKYVTDTGTTILSGVWHHVVGTISSADGLKMYVDGAYKGVNATRLTASTATTDYNIGAYGATGTGFWNGQIMQCRLYSRVLSTNEVSTLYAAGRHAPKDAISTNNLVGFWSMTPPHQAGYSPDASWPTERAGGTNYLTEITLRPQPLLPDGAAATNAWQTYDGAHTITPYNGPIVH